jgi:ketosteroid isomerase-like protein
MKTFLTLIAAIGFFTLTAGDPVKEVKEALDQQVKSWNAGELEKAMSYYWNSPDLLWINRGGVHKGYQPVYDDYKKSYTDKSQMGVYSYEPLHVESLNSDIVYYVFRWKIELDGKKQMGGVSSQIWKKIGNKWVVISEHAS